MVHFVSRAVRTLTGMRAALVLLAVILVLAAAGSIIPQGMPPAAYASLFPRLHPVILLVRLNAVYASPLFRIAGVLLGVSLVVCTIRRLRSARSLRAYASATVHLALAVMVGGGMVSGTGFAGKLIVHTRSFERMAGQGTDRTVALPFSVRLDSFRVVNEDGAVAMAADYVSTVTVRHGTTDTRQVVRMNRPVTVEGYTLSQSGFFKEYLPVLYLDGGEASAETLALRDTVPVPGTAFSVHIGAVYPDFVFDDGTPGTRSNEPRNPFVLLDVFHGSDRFGQCYYAVNDGRVIPRSAFAARLRTHGVLEALRITHCDLHEEYVSVLSVTRDPGAPWVLGGGAVLLAGLTVLFMAPRPGNDGEKNDGDA